MAKLNVYDLFSSQQQHSLSEQLGLLAEIAQGFSSTLDIGQTLQIAIHRFMEYMDAEAASIFLLNQTATELICVECAGPVDITGLTLSARQGIVGKTIQTTSCQLIRDVKSSTDFMDSVDMGTGFVTRSILCVPLVVSGQCIGALELLNKKNGQLFDEQDRHLSVALASAAALAIHNSHIAEQLFEQERLRRELELAREIQMDLLPESGVADFPVQGLNVPALEVSGDFYDFFQLENDLIYFNLADVSGKGMNAALLMARASSLLHHLAKHIDDPGLLLATVNEELCETVSHGMFITIVSGFIDTSNYTVRFANAGHQPPLYHHVSGEFEQFPAQAPPLGIVPGTEYPVTTIELNGGSLYLFTDGVTESMDAQQHMLSVDGLKQLIANKAGVIASRRLDDIVASIREAGTRQHDDITMMVIECCKNK